MVVLSELLHRRTVSAQLANGLNLCSLGLLIWGVTQQGHLGLTGAHLAALALLIGAVASWILWIGARSQGPGPLPRGALVVMAATGGALAAFAPLGLVFLAVAALGTSMLWPLVPALAVTGAGAASMIVSVIVIGHADGVIFGGLAASCAGLVMGISRRQAVEATRQAALLEVETERAGIERGRAELLAERNHLARELHDVLAHTLSALSLQLEALDTVVEVGSEPSERIREHIGGLRRLVQEGLVEAKGAVQALREDAPPLIEQLRRLSIEQHVPLAVEGNPPALTPQASLSLYRIAQEALTNALKHAPGAAVAIRVDGAPERVRLVVENGRSTSASMLASSGGGFGLQGIEERLALLGGSLEAGPTEDGWRVVAEVPVGS